jgi:type I restriction-modification system DNA methylase subunit
MSSITKRSELVYTSFQAELGRLVEQFGRNLSQYKSNAYDEASLRQEFLNPLFRALGWDIENKAGLIPQHREVEIESRTEIAGRQKRADYLFRTDRQDRFVCEAKKPAEELTAPYAFQAKRYSWNKGLVLAVLTDFEEMRIYVVGSRPNPGEADVGLWKTWHFQKYPLIAQEIWDLLARPSVASGSIEKLVEQLPRRPAGKGKARQQWLFKPDRSRSLDADFLNFLDEARRDLASDLIRHNDRVELLEDGRLNEASQRILDRLLFLRICEDRDIDTGRPLAHILKTWRHTAEHSIPPRPRQTHLPLREEGAGYSSQPQPEAGGVLWRDVVAHFRALDRRPPSHIPFFNGNLFKPHFSEELEVSDGWIAGFLDDVGDEESPYLFNVIPVEILGTIYERFLGKVVRPHGRGVVIEEKPEVRKAGGVYYTPRFIVDYIVEQTVGKLLADVKPEASLKLRVLDPACGSGSFLIRAFERICEHWQTILTKNPKERRRADCWTDPVTGDVHLTSTLKRRILTSNIYGVDIDDGAVEVTQLSLYLKMLEGENRTTIARERDLFGSDDALLPPLEGNIKCGNSLIAANFSTVAEELVRVHAFDWPVQFSAIMKAGGFDAVIGNPPYLNIDDSWGKGNIQLEAIKLQYPHVYNDKSDILFYFIARAYELSKKSVGYIVSRAFLEAFKADKLRGFLAAKRVVSQIVDFRNFYVFEGVGITTCLLLLEKEPFAAKSTLDVYKLVHNKLPSQPLYDLLADIKVFEHYRVSRAALSNDVWTFASPEQSALNSKIDAGGEPLGKILHIGQGMQTGCNEVFGLHTLSEMREWRVHERLYRHRASNSDIQRYDIRDRGEILIYVEEGDAFEKLPERLKRHFENCSDSLKARAAYKRGNCDWWRYTWPLHQEYYSRRRIISPFLATENRFALVEDGRFIGLTDTIVLFENKQPESLKYLLGILNSKLLTVRFRTIGKLKGGGIYEYFWNSVSKLPIRRIDFASTADRTRHDRLVGLVDKMLDLVPKLRTARSESERATLQNAVTATDQQINALVYELYGLTPEEIELVEKNDSSAGYMTAHGADETDDAKDFAPAARSREHSTFRLEE